MVAAHHPHSLSWRTLYWSLALAAATALILHEDITYLFASPYPYGSDGYYYLAQVNTLNETGHLFRDAPPLTFYIMKALCAFLEPAQAIKLAGLLFLTITGLLAFSIVQCLTRQPLAAVLGFVIVLRGFIHPELLINFLKQSLGHVWVMMALLLLALCTRSQTLRTTETPVPRWRVAGCVMLLLFTMIAASFTHTFSISLVMLFLAVWICWQFLLWLTPRHAPWTGLIAAISGPWVITGILAHVAIYLPPALRALDRQFLTQHPRFTCPTIAETSHGVPLGWILTLLLFGAIAACAFMTLRHASADRDQVSPSIPPATPFLRFWIVLIPYVALSYSPFLISIMDNSMGLQLRLVVALSLPAAILIPGALTLGRMPDALRTVIFTILIGLFAGIPPAWNGAPGPPADGGMLHEAMLRSKAFVPPDAIIVTNHRTGNMVNALWNRPRVIDAQYDLRKADTDHYRLISLGSEEQNELASFAQDHPESPKPVLIMGPWVLLQEPLYRAFREQQKDKEGS